MYIGQLEKDSEVVQIQGAPASLRCHSSYRVVCQLPAEVCSQIIPARLQQHHVATMLAGQILARQQVGSDVFADRCVRAAACVWTEDLGAEVISTKHQKEVQES
jgi:hypothetical protein